MFVLEIVVSILFNLQLPPLAPNIFCFSNHQETLLFFFLLLSLPPSILQWHHEGGIFFSEYVVQPEILTVGVQINSPDWATEETFQQPTKIAEDVKVLTKSLH